MTWGCLEKTQIGRVGLPSNPLVQVAHCSISSASIILLLRKFEYRAPVRQSSGRSHLSNAAEPQRESLFDLENFQATQ